MRNLNSRTIHRYLSVVIGVQLLLWTASGLIFSWNPIAKVRGENLISKPEQVDLSSIELISFSDLKVANEKILADTMIESVLIRDLLGTPVMEVAFSTPNLTTEHKIFDATNGKLLSPVDEKLAQQIAIADFAETADVRSVEYVTSAGSHSEYRGKELPAYRVVMEHPTSTAIYVSPERGVVTTRRNNRWRVFDFFWMLHTMDYQGRDNFGHWLLRAFSVFGLTTVLSGYWLWWRTSRFRRKQPKSKAKTIENA